MPRYYNTLTKTEAIPGKHETNVPEVVILADDNPYWHPLPEGKRLTFNYNGVPDGLEDIPPAVLTPDQQARNALHEAGVTGASIAIALYYATQKSDTSRLDAIEAVVNQIAADTGLSTGSVVEQVS